MKKKIIFSVCVETYLILGIDDQWATALDATTVAHLTTTSTEALRLVDLHK